MDAARLLNDGIPVTLADGSTVTVRFDFEAMLRLEALYGSTYDYLTALDAQFKGKGFGAIVAGLRAASRERDIATKDLDPRQFRAYRQALVEAWFAAMPEVEAKADEGKAEGQDGTGLGSTTSELSRLDDRKKRGVA